MTGFRAANEKTPAPDMKCDSTRARCTSAPNREKFHRAQFARDSSPDGEEILWPSEESRLENPAMRSALLVWRTIRKSPADSRRPRQEMRTPFPLPKPLKPGR